MNPLPWIAAALAGLAAVTSCHHDPAAVQRAQAQAATSAAQAHLERATLTASDHAAARAAQSQQATDEATDAVHASPSAGDPVPPDLLSAWRAGVQRVRADGDQPDPDAHDPGAAHSAVPAS